MEAIPEKSPEPVRETARVPPPQPDDAVRHPASDPISPPPQDRAPEPDVPTPPPPPQRQVLDGPEVRKRKDMYIATSSGVILGFFVLAFCIGVGVPWWIAWLPALVVGGGFWGHILEERPKRRGERSAVRSTPVHTRHIPQWVKIAVATRDAGKCRSCGSAYELQYDHVIPFSRGGSSTDVNNIQLLCGRCNRLKSNRYIG